MPELRSAHSQEGFRAVTEESSGSRHYVSWHALGEAIACYEAALAHALRRQQFGQPLAAFQLVQAKPVRMLGEITKALASRYPARPAARSSSRPSWMTRSWALVISPSMRTSLAWTSWNAASGWPNCCRRNAWASAAS